MMRLFLFPNTWKRLVVLVIAVCGAFMYVRNMVLIWNTVLSKNATMTGNDVSIQDVNYHNWNLFDMTAPDIYSRYIKFNLKEYGKQCHGRRFMVYFCGGSCGGWGDRLKGIISVFLFAQLTNRTFVIDMSRPCELNTLLKPNLYDWTKCLAEVKRTNSSEVLRSRNFSEPRVDDVVLGKLDKYRVIRMFSRGIQVNKIRRHAFTYNIIPWIHSFTNEEIFGSVIGLLFKPSPKLTVALMVFKNENIQNRRLVCSHMRFGRNPSIPSDRNLRQGTPNISNVFEFLTKFDAMYDTAIFVATDSTEVRAQARTLFANFISTERQIVHVDQVRADRNESCDGFFAVLLDHLILSRCDVLVLTRSNFGTMAAYMRGETKNLYLNVKDHEHIVSAANLSDIQNTYRFT